jgi:hypothetical protein
LPGRPPHRFLGECRRIDAIRWLEGEPLGEASGLCHALAALDRLRHRRARGGREDPHFCQPANGLARLVLGPGEVPVFQSFSDRRQGGGIAEDAGGKHHPERAGLLPQAARQLVGLDAERRRARGFRDCNHLQAPPASGPRIEILAIPSFVIGLTVALDRGMEPLEIAGQEPADHPRQISLPVANAEVLRSEEERDRIQITEVVVGRAGARCARAHPRLTTVAERKLFEGVHVVSADSRSAA